MTQNPIYVDATTLITLGKVGELSHLNHFDGEPVILPEVVKEVTAEPAKTNLRDFIESNDIRTEDGEAEQHLEKAKRVLEEDTENGDVWIIAGVLAHEKACVVSDDKRVRTVSSGFGAQVTGTIGVVVRAVDEELSEKEGKELVRRIDSHGLHMTGELREKAYELIENVSK